MAKWDKDAVNADLRRRFGKTFTRQQMLDYKEETGCFPVWIYRDPACKVGRCLYAIPGADASESDTDETVALTDVDLGKVDFSKKTPARPAPVAKRAKRVVAEHSGMTNAFDDETMRLVHRTVFVCTKDKQKLYVPAGEPVPETPVCPVCGTKMFRHYYAEKVKK